MRLIGTIDNKKQAQEFSYFLIKEGIANQCEIIVNTDWGSSDYGNVTCKIWVHDEDQVESAQKWFELFKQDPNDPRFYGHAPAAPLGTPPIEPDVVVEEGRGKANIPRTDFLRRRALTENQPLGLITLYIIIVCVWLFVWGMATSPPVPSPLPTNVPLTPILEPAIYKKMLFDYPKAFELVDELVEKFGVEKVADPTQLPPDGYYLFERFLHTPYWEGLYVKLVDWARGTKEMASMTFKTPLFEKIRQGEFWRLFSPCLLHANVLHILFNLIWLIILGKQIENRIGGLRYSIFILASAVISNTAQYLMSGANFLGISGVLCAMFTFIWMRQRIAAWEGYQMAPGVIAFIGFFIGIMLGVQVISFFLEVYTNVSITPGIANTAHFVGAAAGAVMGRMKFFNWSSIG